MRVEAIVALAGAIVIVLLAGVTINNWAKTEILLALFKKREK